MPETLETLRAMWAHSERHTEKMCTGQFIRDPEAGCYYATLRPTEGQPWVFIQRLTRDMKVEQCFVILDDAYALSDEVAFTEKAE